MEAEGFPALLPIAEPCDSAEKEVDSAEKEEELGIYQVLERLEEITIVLISRWVRKISEVIFSFFHFCISCL